MERGPRKEVNTRHHTAVAFQSMHACMVPQPRSLARSLFYLLSASGVWRNERAEVAYTPGLLTSVDNNERPAPVCRTGRERALCP